MIRALLCGVLAPCALTTGSFAQSAVAENVAEKREATAGPTILFDQHGPREVTLVPASEVLDTSSEPAALENIYRHSAAKNNLMMASDDAVLTDVSDVRGGELMLLRYFQRTRQASTQLES